VAFPVWLPVLGPILARRRMKSELPVLAERWGLGFVESDRRHWWGRFEGTLEEHTVRIEPEVPSLSVVFSREVTDFQASTLDIGQKPRDLGLDHPRFEKVFRSIDLGPEAARRLRGRTDVLDRILSLWEPRISGISLGESLLSCILYYPFDVRKGPHYVETADVERLLPEMIGVVRLLEDVLGTGRG